MFRVFKRGMKKTKQRWDKDSYCMLAKVQSYQLSQDQILLKRSLNLPRIWQGCNVKQRNWHVKNDYFVKIVCTDNLGLKKYLWFLGTAQESI